MLDAFTFWSIVLAVLIAYLCVSVVLRLGLRLRAEEVRRRASEKEFTGTAFDVSAIAPQLQQLRQDHLAAPHSRPCHSFYRTGLMAAARRMVTNLRYFRRVRPEHEAQKHDA
jgi:hypothetical protein